MVLGLAPIKGQAEAAAVAVEEPIAVVALLPPMVDPVVQTPEVVVAEQAELHQGVLVPVVFQ
jgi:hypothetical protein